MALNPKETKSLAKYIYENYCGEKINLQDYISNSLDDFSRELNYTYSLDEILEHLYDGIGYKRLVQGIKSIAEMDLINRHDSKIRIYSEHCYEYIETTEYGRRTNERKHVELFAALEGLESLDDVQKGNCYEIFSSLFFKDIGFEASSTRSTNDGGIDIVGRVNIDFQRKVLNNFFGKNGVNILAQVKYHLVDTPVVRNLIGDSLFYRFQAQSPMLDRNQIVLNNHPTYLCVISHKGFTSRAKEFARINGVITLDSHQMVDILCSLGNLHQLESTKYLQGKQNCIDRK